MQCATDKHSPQHLKKRKKKTCFPPSTTPVLVQIICSIGAHMPVPAKQTRVSNKKPDFCDTCDDGGFNWKVTLRGVHPGAITGKIYSATARGALLSYIT